MIAKLLSTETLTVSILVSLDSMITWQLTRSPTGGVISISMPVEQADAKATFEVSGDESDLRWLEYELSFACGRYGHALKSLTTALDLHAALSKLEDFEVQLLQGSEVLETALELPPEAKT